MRTNEGNWFLLYAIPPRHTLPFHTPPFFTCLLFAHCFQEQVADYKQQVRILQQKIESIQLHIDRDKKEKERSLQEERGKVEAIRVRMDTQREELVKVDILTSRSYSLVLHSYHANIQTSEHSSITFVSSPTNSYRRSGGKSSRRNWKNNKNH